MRLLFLTTRELLSCGLTMCVPSTKRMSVSCGCAWRLAVVSEGPAETPAYTEVRSSPGFWTFRRSDLWAAAMSQTVWMSINDAHLASHLQRASTLRWAPTRRGAGVNRDWLARMPDRPRSRSAAPGNAADKMRTDRHYSFISIDSFILCGTGIQMS